MNVLLQAYLQSKNIFHQITMMTDMVEDEGNVELKWAQSKVHKTFKIMYVIVDDLGEIISEKDLLSCNLMIRTKMHPFLGDFIVHVSNQTKLYYRNQS